MESPFCVPSDLGTFSVVWYFVHPGAHSLLPSFHPTTHRSCRYSRLLPNRSDSPSVSVGSAPRLLYVFTGRYRKEDMSQWPVLVRDPSCRNHGWGVTSRLVPSPRLEGCPPPDVRRKNTGDVGLSDFQTAVQDEMFIDSSMRHTIYHLIPNKGDKF